jgi:hypothetical protein
LLSATSQIDAFLIRLLTLSKTCLGCKEKSPFLTEQSLNYKLISKLYLIKLLDRELVKIAVKPVEKNLYPKTPLFPVIKLGDV